MQRPEPSHEEKIPADILSRLHVTLVWYDGGKPIDWRTAPSDFRLPMHRGSLRALHDGFRDVVQAATVRHDFRRKDHTIDVRIITSPTDDTRTILYRLNPARGSILPRRIANAVRTDETAHYLAEGAPFVLDDDEASRLAAVLDANKPISLEDDTSVELVFTFPLPRTGHEATRALAAASER